MPHFGFLKIALAALLVWCGAPRAALASLRAVSLNLCTDQLLVLIAPKDVAGLSPLARNPALSAVAQEAAKLPIVSPIAETIFHRHPDLVLAETSGEQLLLGVLRHLGLRVITIQDPQNFAEIEAAITKIAALLGVPTRGATLNAGIEATLARLPRTIGPRTAIVWEPRGLTPGPNSLPGAILAAAGYRNAARGGTLELETLLSHPPDLLVIPGGPGMPSLATTMLSGPILASIPHRSVPASWLICGSPFSAQAAERIAR